jgi:hypothetical protein
MEPKGSLLHSQVPAVCPCPEPDSIFGIVGNMYFLVISVNFPGDDHAMIKTRLLQ